VKASTIGIRTLVDYFVWLKDHQHCDDDHDWEAGGSSMGCNLMAAPSDKHPMRPPRDHIKRLHVVACPNHVFPVRHKLKDYGMMRCFKTLGTLTWGAKLEKGPNGSDMMAFHEENTIMTVYRGRLLSGRRHMSNLSPRTPTCCGWLHGGSGV
jgi:hypothetical protein